MSPMRRFHAEVGVLAASAALLTAPLPATSVLRPSDTGAPAGIFGDLINASDSGVRTVPSSVASDLARRILRIERLMKQLSNDEGFLRSADDVTLLLLFNRSEGKAELLRSYDAIFGEADAPDDLFTHLDRALDELWREITRLAPTYASPGGHPLMRKVETAVERRLRVMVPKATYVGGALREREWRVKRNALGIPESRSMSGVLFYRVPDQPWLICREFEIAQRYFDRSTEDPGEITLGCLRLQGSV